MNRFHASVRLTLGLLGLLAIIGFSANCFSSPAPLVPGNIWLQYATPKEAGWSAAKLEEARRYSESIGSASVFVVYDGAVLAAWGDYQRRFWCHSIRKSFLSALYGIEVAAGKIDLQKSLADLQIEEHPPLSDLEKTAKIVDLLKARSGIYLPAAYEGSVAKPPRGQFAPGSHWFYNNWDFNVLGTIFEKETHTGIFDQFKQRIADPVQMEDYRVRDGYYHFEPDKSIHPAYPFRMSARDMARFALLFMRKAAGISSKSFPPLGFKRALAVIPTHTGFMMVTVICGGPWKPAVSRSWECFRPSAPAGIPSKCYPGRSWSSSIG